MDLTDFFAITFLINLCRNSLDTIIVRLTNDNIANKIFMFCQLIFIMILLMYKYHISHLYQEYNVI